MLNPSILSKEVQQYIEAQLQSNIHELALKGSPFPDITTSDLLEQIEAKKRSVLKLPTWYATTAIYYPNKLNIEQSSSEITAKYKASLLKGAHLIDVTGGFGVDSYFFSKSFTHVTHYEINEKLSKIVAHNFKQLQASSIKTIFGNGLSLLLSSKTKADMIYIDPSRRDAKNSKIVRLNDYSPNIIPYITDLLNIAPTLLIKTSPLLDIQLGLQQLNAVSEVHVVAVSNDVKELLWVLKKETTSQNPEIKTINLLKSGHEQFDFHYKDEAHSNATLGLPETYLYEPNSAILKAGAFKLVSEKYKIKKLQQHSHLYTTTNLISFPGRRFKILAAHPFNNASISGLNISKANITTRNFPISVAKLRKRFNIKDGGANYLFFTTNMNDEKIVLCCEKL